jgi:hypothetical protein
MHKIKVWARGNTQFYFRNWKEGKQSDTRIIEAIRKELSKVSRQNWENIPSRIRQYPACLYAVLCHRENSPNFRGKKIEWIDAVPQFGININPNVRTTTDGTYDLLTEQAEWHRIELGGKIKYPNALLTNPEGAEEKPWWSSVREAQRKAAGLQNREAAAELEKSRNERLDT